MTDVQFGSVEAASTAASYTDASAGLMDSDGANYAQLTAKTTGSGSFGWKLRAIVAGVLTTLLTFTAGTTNAVFAGNVSAQAVTATGLTSSGVIAFTPTSLNVGSGSATDSNSLTLQAADSNYLVRFKNAAGTSLGGITSVGGVGLKFDNANGVSFASVTIASGLTVSAGGITVSAGNTSLAGYLQVATSVTSGLEAGDIALKHNGRIFMENAAGGGTIAYVASVGDNVYYGDPSSVIHVRGSNISSGASQAVSAGANDSGGTGFRVLCIPN